VFDDAAVRSYAHRPVTLDGGMSAAMMEVGGPERDYAFFDSFAGLPPAEVIDGPLAVAWQSNTSRLDKPCKHVSGAL
jgi:hypothetical protein